MKIDIFGDNISYVTDEVSTVPTKLANLNEENRIKFVTDLAAISRGKSESSNPSKRYQQLLKEAALGTPSRPLEFLPVVLTGAIDCDIFPYEIVSEEDKKEKVINRVAPYISIYGRKEKVKVDFQLFMNTLGRFSYIAPYYTDDIVKLHNKDTLATNFKVLKIYTNMRAILNTSYFEYDNVPYIEPLRPYITKTNEYMYEQFKAIKLKIPMFVWSQWPMTHTMLSKESQSDRVASEEDYWLPQYLEKRTKNPTEKLDNPHIGSQFEVAYIQEYIKEYESGKYSDKFKAFNDFFKFMMVNLVTQDEVQTYLKSIGYKQEIWSRAPYYFKYKEVVVTGWYCDPTTWKHSFIERNCEPELWKNWTQKETQQVLQTVKQIIEKE